MTIVQRLFLFAIAISASVSTTSAVYASCNQVPDVATARVRWADARQRSFGPAHDEERCRANSSLFLEAVNTRQVASICEEGAKRQHDLDTLDAEIDAFNDLIAAQCGGS
jgi:hypothetical protein